MLETIQQEIQETHDRQAVMILLQGLDCRLAVLHIKTPSIEGELWFAQSKYLVFGKASPGGDLPLLDMLRLLAIKEGEFSLETRSDEPPSCPVSISLAELVADEHAVARKIKDVLWPVDPVAESELAEEITKERLRRLETTKDYGKDAKAAAGKPERDFDETTEIRLPKSDETDAPAATDNAEPDDAAAELSKTTDEPASEMPTATLSDSDQPDLDFSPPKQALQESGQQAGEPSPAQPPSARRKDEPAETDQQPETEQQSKQTDEYSETAQQPATDQQADKHPEQSDDDSHCQTAEISLPPQQPPASDDETIAIAVPAAAADTTAGTTPSAEETQPIPAGAAASTHDATLFYERDQSMTEDDLASRRAEEMAALNQLLSEHAGKSKTKSFDADPASGSDEQAAKPTALDSSGKLSSRRRADYEALKTFFSEDPEKFYDKSGATDAPQEGLDDFKKRILEIAGEELSDESGFSASDPRLKEGGDIRPVWTAPSTEPPQTEAQEPPEPPKTPPAEPIVSPYADMASALVRGEVNKTQLGVDPQADDLTLLERQQSKSNIPTVKESLLRRQPLPKKVILAAIAGAAFVPAATYVTWHYFDAQSQEELSEQREATLLAQRSLDEKSLVAKPQEAFRMPGGGTGISAPANNVNNNSSQSITRGQRDADYTFREPSNPMTPLNDHDTTRINSAMVHADRIASGGNAEAAITDLTSLIQKYPSYALLRVKAARLCIMARKYRQAYDICVAGLPLCRTHGDFDMLMSVVHEIPAN